MDRHKLITVLLAAVFSVLTFAPTKTSSELLGIRPESKLWIRLAGILGLVSIALGLTIDYSRALELSVRTEKTLFMLKHYCGGAIVGLFVAMLTKRYEKV